MHASPLEFAPARRAIEELRARLRDHHNPTVEHSDRVALLSRAVARHLAMDFLEVVEVELVAIVHDVGKLFVPHAILTKSGPLTDDERAVMLEHTVAGEKLLVETAGLDHLAAAVRHSHERWDGLGYPDGLAGEEIPLHSRIVSACDALDAMTSDRDYRRALPPNVARPEIAVNAGRQFDPIVAVALLDLTAATGELRPFIVDRVAAS